MTDRDPYAAGRVIDLTPKAFNTLFSSTRKAVSSALVVNPALGASSDYAAFRARSRQRIVSDDIGFVKRLVRRGLGIALYTGLGFRDEIASGELVWVPACSSEMARLRVGLFLSTLRTPTPACHALAGAIARALTSWEQDPS